MHGHGAGYGRAQQRTWRRQQQLHMQFTSSTGVHARIKKRHLEWRSWRTRLVQALLQALTTTTAVKGSVPLLNPAQALEVHSPAARTPE